jgi:hypothetical protein
VLGHLFGPDLPLLKDEAYFSRWTVPYQFVRVTDEVNPRQSAEHAIQRAATR